MYAIYISKYPAVGQIASYVLSAYGRLPGNQQYENYYDGHFFTLVRVMKLIMHNNMYDSDKYLLYSG